MNADHALWRRALLTFGLLVSATFVGVFLLGGARADGCGLPIFCGAGSGAGDGKS